MAAQQHPQSNATATIGRQDAAPSSLQRDPPPLGCASWLEWEQTLPSPLPGSPAWSRQHQGYQEPPARAAIAEELPSPSPAGYALAAAERLAASAATLAADIVKEFGLGDELTAAMQLHEAALGLLADEERRYTDHGPEVAT